ncbi:MAG: hypothetical protein J6W60_14030 [Treponema sp.]|nr:hypothetical protein [Treponema sp.]
MLTCKRTITFAAICLACGFAFSQGLSAPSMPTISSPTMPTVSTPVIGSSFSYSNSNSANSSKNSAEKKNASDEEKNSSGKKKLADSLSTLTASDLQTLSATGMLNTLLDSQAGSSSLTGLSNLYTSSSASETNVLLKQVLTEMEEIKKQTSVPEKVASQAQQAPVVTSTGNTSTVRAKPSRLIRFSVNGYDVLRTCRTIYISDVQEDGTFLVTGDRKYSSDGKTRSETFHLLFKKDQGSSGLQNYHAAAAVTQDYLNEYSFLYQLSQRENLSAMRTGNLVTMRTTDPDWKLELLIDLGENGK